MSGILGKIVKLQKNLKRVGKEAGPEQANRLWVKTKGHAYRPLQFVLTGTL